MSRILATVELADGRALDLTVDDGWRFRGSPKGPLERLVDGVVAAADAGPAAGDPVYLAAARAARLLGASIVFVRTPEPVPDDAVF